MILKVAVARGVGGKADLQWWKGYSNLPTAELRRRLEVGEPCVAFDYHSGIDEAPEIARELLYDFIHEAHELGQALAFYEMSPGIDDDFLPPSGGWDAKSVSAGQVLDSLRTSEINEHQSRHQDDRDGGHDDPQAHADRLAEARERRWRELESES